MNTSIRAIQLDLDTLSYVNGRYDRHELEQHIMRQVVDINANTVYLQSFIEDRVDNDDEYNKKTHALFFTPPASVEAHVADGSLLADATHLIKRHLPHCTVLAWAPTLNCAWLTENEDDNQVMAPPQAEPVWYCRATPFGQRTRNLLSDMYHALGAVSPQLDGVLFQDDMLLSNWEDVSPAGKALLKQHFSVDVDDDDALFEFLSNDDDPQNMHWKTLKTQALNDLSVTMFNAFRDGYRTAFPDAFASRQHTPSSRLLCARDLYAKTIDGADDRTGEWYSPSLDLSLDLYDQVVIMMYYNEEHGYVEGDEMSMTQHSHDWLSTLARRAVDIADQDGAERSNKLVMKLQSVIWNQGEEDLRIQRHVLKAQAHQLTHAGIEHLAFYPALETVSRIDLDTL